MVQVMVANEEMTVGVREGGSMLSVPAIGVKLTPVTTLAIGSPPASWRWICNDGVGCVLGGCLRPTILVISGAAWPLKVEQLVKATSLYPPGTFWLSLPGGTSLTVNVFYPGSAVAAG